MTEGIRGYLLSVSAAAVLLALVQTVLPQNAVKRVAAFSGGLLLMLAVLSPLVKISADELEQMLGQLRPDTEVVQQQAETAVRESMAVLIKQKCETYILDKAQQLGLTLRVEVSLSEEGVYPVPERVALIGYASSAQQQTLGNIISNDLGIPHHRQEWRTS